MNRLLLLIACVAQITLPMAAPGQGNLVQVHQDFSQDPGWEWKHNRIVAEDPPVVKQDFGWVPTNHTAAAEAGEIGGRIWRSATPAYYALPLNRATDSSFRPNSRNARASSLSAPASS